MLNICTYFVVISVCTLGLCNNNRQILTEFWELDRIEVVAVEYYKSKWKIK